MGSNPILSAQIKQTIYLTICQVYDTIFGELESPAHPSTKAGSGMNIRSRKTLITARRIKMSTLTMDVGWSNSAGSMYLGKAPDTFSSDLLRKVKRYAQEGFAYAAIPFVEHFAVKRGAMQKTDSVFYEWPIRLTLLWWFLFSAVTLSIGLTSLDLVSQGIFGRTATVTEIRPRQAAESEITTVTSPERVRFEVVESGTASTRLVEFGVLEGVNVGKWEHAPTKPERNLNALYTGVEGIVPASMTINPCEQFKAAWRAKLARKEVTGATLKTIPFIVRQFCQGTRTYTDVKTFVGDINQALSLATASIDFESLCADARYKLSRLKCDLLKEVAENTTGEELVTYGLTELMPAQKRGLLNAQILDHMLRNCSLECVMNFPALNDKMASVGFWQFTSFAVYRTRGDGKDARGASIVSLYAGEDFKISTSVVGENGLTPREHVLAAHYFGLHNIALLLRYASDNEVVEFKRVVDAGRTEDVLTFKAIAHHLPSPAINRTRAWLAHGAKGSLRGALGPALTIYAIKTHYNLLGLGKFLKKQ